MITYDSEKNSLPDSPNHLNQPLNQLDILKKILLHTLESNENKLAYLQQEVLMEHYSINSARIADKLLEYSVKLDRIELETA